MVKTKIVCTIGPSTESQDQINKLILTGMNVARINLSHGTLEQYESMIKRIRKASRTVAILMDTSGPEIRTGMIKENTVLNAGQTFTLTTRKVMGDDNHVSITYANLPDETFKGDTILLDNGTIELSVLERSKDAITCKVMNGGALGNQKGVNHPSRPSSLPALKPKDKEGILLGCKHGLDFVAVSFVRNAQDIRTVRNFLRHHPGVKLIAKIEAAEGVKNFDEILEEADGIMVARGDLGIEIPAEEVPLVQKQIIKKCNLAGKPVITATQMLESMVRAPRPTRAEASDVANAIFDGTDAVMLSEETAMGKYPLHAVRVMRRIARKVESVLDHKHKIELKNTDDAIAKAVLDIVSASKVTKILIATKTGFSAQNISKFRPEAEIISATPYPHILRQLSLVWGVKAIYCPVEIHSTRQLIKSALMQALKEKMISKRDKVVIATASPITRKSHTNLIEVQHVGEWLKKTH